jgi:peptidyl-Lys metalloendopeptidase
MMRQLAGFVSLVGLTVGALACALHRERGNVGTNLECTLSAPHRVRVGEPVPVHFRLTNRAPGPLYVLTWRTPLEGLRGNDFLITRDGEELRYRGPMVKRGEPEREHYVVIASDASADADVDLAPAYDFQQPGRYRIAFRGPVMDVAERATDIPRPLELLRPVPVACPVAEVEVLPAQ